MIDLYFAPTPNGQKISIMLEECDLPYNAVPVNILAGEQFTPEFLTINPNGKIPAIIDHEPDPPLAIFESGAILLYLAEKTGQFMPPREDVHGRYAVMQWLMFQMSGIGPMFGQAGHFLNYAPEAVPYAIKRYRREVGRLYDVLDGQLAQNEYIAGEQYTIADMAIYPWVTLYKGHQQDLSQVPHVRRWYDQLKQRPALRRGYALLRETLPRQMSAQEKKTLFGIEPEDSNQ
jgi:GST-like protein